MPISEAVDLTFRQLVYNGETTFEDLWLAFWSGEFEGRGKCGVTIEFPPEVRPATRNLLIHTYPDGGWVPIPGQETTEREAHWSRFASTPQYGIDSNWLKRTFGGIRISRENFDKWQATRGDEIGQRILRILNAAANIRQHDSELSDREVTAKLFEGKTKVASYNKTAVRKILGEKYRPAMKRGLPGLDAWIQRNPQ